MTQPRTVWMRWRVRVGYPVAVIYWLLAAPSRHSILYGGIVAVFGLLVRGAASGHLRKDQELAASGPYARTRNPLYLGSALLAAGFVIAGRSWWAGVLVAAYFTVFYWAVMRNEEAVLRERFGAVFDAYARRVPLFFPGIWAKRDGPSATAHTGPAFSWAQYRRNREYNALIGTFAGWGIAWLRMWLRMRWGY